MEADLNLQALLEAILYASPQPVPLRQLTRALGQPDEVIRELLEQIRKDQDQPERGLFLRESRGGYQIGTKPELGPALQQALRGLRPRPPLSRPALETLAIIAYKQPVSVTEIQKIRRTDTAGVIETLLKRKLVTTAGHKPGGRAQLYRTTSQFLADFGLRDLKELPALAEFKELRTQYEQFYRTDPLDTGANP